jgi:hypothetical protein
VPFHWVKILSSPPKERRETVRDICFRHGARLCEGQTYYDAQGAAYSLVEVPAEEPEQRALLDELQATQWLGLVDADEHASETKPPFSGGRQADYD